MGPPLPDEPASGLHFICLNANIGRQFEFVQSSWLHSTVFDGLRDENDPLTGNRKTLSGCPADRFTLPTAGGVQAADQQGSPLHHDAWGSVFFSAWNSRASLHRARRRALVDGGCDAKVFQEADLQVDLTSKPALLCSGIPQRYLACVC